MRPIASSIAAVIAGVVLFAAGVMPVHAEGVCGDWSHDGTANSVDALIGLQYVAGLYDPGVAIIVNKYDPHTDLSITSIDAQLILQYDAGLLDTLACF